MTTKTCKKCGETKTLDCFRKQSGMRDGLRGSCVACDNARRTFLMRQRSPEAKAAANEKTKAWQRANRARATELAAKYRAAKPEKYKAAALARRKKAVAGLSDGYVRERMRIPFRDITPELIAAERERLQSKRDKKKNSSEQEAR